MYISISGEVEGFRGPLIAHATENQLIVNTEPDYLNVEQSRGLQNHQNPVGLCHIYDVITNRLHVKNRSACTI